MPNKNLISGQQGLCHSCIHVDECKNAHDRMFTCAGYISPQDQIKLRQKVEDLTFLVKTSQGARIYRDKINEYIFEPELFTGNSETHFKLGQRSIIMAELKILLDVLDLDDYTDLVIFLNNSIPKEIKQ